MAKVILAHSMWYTEGKVIKQVVARQSVDGDSIDIASIVPSPISTYEFLLFVDIGLQHVFWCTCTTFLYSFKIHNITCYIVRP